MLGAIFLLTVVHWLGNDMRPPQHFRKSRKMLLDTHAFQYLGSAFTRFELIIYSQSWAHTLFGMGFVSMVFFNLASGFSAELTSP